jgi:hypothetical protein
MKLLALGDSYTIGEGVSKTDSWPVQLCRMVRALGDSDPLIIAKTGWTTVDLLQAIAGEDLSTTYALVSLLVGVNDQYDGLGLDTFRSGLATLLLKSIELAKQDPSHVIVLSIPDYSITPLVEGMDQARVFTTLTSPIYLAERNGIPPFWRRTVCTPPEKCTRSGQRGSPR